MDPESRRIRSYLQTQAAKLTPAQLVEKVRIDMQQLHQALDAVPAERFTERPAQGEWSANEVAAHVVAASDAFALAIQAILDGRDSPRGLADVMSAGAPMKTPAEWWDLHVQNRDRLFEHALAAPPNAHLDKTVRHAMFGDLNWRETLLFLRVHDLDHARQLQAIAEEFSS